MSALKRVTPSPAVVSLKGLKKAGYMFYYQFNIGDYQSHTSHLSEMEDLAFRRMLDWCYLHEKPLPSDANEIARLIRMRTHSESIAVVLQEYFERNEDGWISLRVIAEILKVGMKSEKASASAKARWGKKDNKNKDLQDNAIDDANALRTQSDGNATQDTEHKTQDTKHKKETYTPEGVSQSVWQDFVKHRKTKKAAISELVIKGIQKEADKAKITLEEALTETIIRGWISFKADWFVKPIQSAQQETFKERDARLGRERWEEMTGRSHPDSKLTYIDAPSRNILEITND